MNRVILIALLIAPLFTAGIALGGIQNAYAGDGPVCIDPPPNLVSWWPLDETSGTLGGTPAVDVADGNDGLYFGSPTPIAGKVDGAVDFAGSSGYVDAGNPANLQLDTGTVDAWIKTSDAGSGFRAIAVKGNAYGMFLKDDIFGIFDWNTAMFRSTGINLADGQFHHVAFTFQSGVDSGTVLYIDGVAQLTTNMTVNNQNTKFLIGSNTFIQKFNGIIDEVEVFDRVLTPTEIEEIFDADDAGKCKPIQVDIDIKPGSDPNAINLNKKKGSTPVAILGSASFDVTTIDVTTLTFGPSGALPKHDLTDGVVYASHLEDVNSDGLLDLVVHFINPDTGISPGDTKACVVGALDDATAIKGCDNIKTIPSS